MEELEKKKRQIEQSSIDVLQKEFTKDITLLSNTKGAFSLFRRIIYRLGVFKRKELL